MNHERPSTVPLPEPYLAAAPAPWAARGLAVVLLVLAGVAFAVSVLVQVPETVRATFVLVPIGGADPIRAPRSGAVAAVRVAEGHVVRAGEPAFVIRAASVGASRAELGGLERRAADGGERASLERERHESQARADAAEERRLEARLEHLAQRAAQLAAKRPAEEERYQARLRALEAEIATLGRELEFKTSHLALSREIAARHQGGYEKGFLSWMEYVRPKIEAERVGTDLSGLERQREASLARRAQLMAERRNEELESVLAVAAVEADMRDTRSGLERLRAEMTGRLAAGRERDRSLREERDREALRIDALRRDLADSHGDEQVVSAPCTGTVLRLGARAAGAVVQEGELLAEVACAETPLHAELSLPRDGVGRLRAGLGAKLLYDAFPYQRHGARAGRVTWVSPSVVASAGAGSFRAHVAIADGALRIDGRTQPLLVGMTGNVEIVVGRRALIAYAFEPLRALRENLSTGEQAAAPGTPTHVLRPAPASARRGG